MTAHRDPEAKRAHIDVVRSGRAETPQSGLGLQFRDLHFVPKALPEISLEAVDLRTTLLQKPISAPIMIAPMTGGIDDAGALNRLMAEVAETLGIPFGLGSQRVALEDPARAKSFQVRAVAPTIPLFANLGAVQLVRGLGPEDAERAVTMVEADALFLHLNAMQEALQPNGDTDWRGVLRQIERVVSHFEARGLGPVWVREVGFGLDADTTRRLLAAGVAGIDAGGQGGTSWTRVEAELLTDPAAQEVAAVFADWGLSTPETIAQVRSVDRGIPLIATGGVRSGLDAAKAVALGAGCVGIAGPVLRAALQGPDTLGAFLRSVMGGMRRAMFGVGAGNVEQLLDCSRLRPRSLVLENFGARRARSLRS